MSLAKMVSTLDKTSTAPFSLFIAHISCSYQRLTFISFFNCGSAIIFFLFQKFSKFDKY